MLRSFRYAALWWLAVAASITVLSLVGTKIWDTATREPVVEITEADVDRAFTDATTNVKLARIASIQALSKAQLSLPERRFTMNEDERAERLFTIGYRHCQTRNFGSCEAIMKRVASLKKGNAGQAFRLQAWASAARGGDVGKFPTVENVPSLTDIETSELSEELGVPVPPPLPEEPQPAAADAGTVDAETDALPETP